MSGMKKVIEKVLPHFRQPVYKFVPDAEGINWDMWAGDSSAPHGTIDEVFTGGPDLWGTPGHVNGAPSHSGTHDDMNFNDIVLLGDRALALEGNQQARIYGYKRIEEDGFLRDNNGNTGETGRMYCGMPDGCCNNFMGLVHDQLTNTNGAVRGILGATPVPVKAGDMIPYVILMSDATAFFGLDLEFSADGQTGWSDVQSFVGKGEWIKREIGICVVPDEDETVCPPPSCCGNPILLAIYT